MTMLHSWFWAKVLWGKSEQGERCRGCRRTLPINTTCLVTRVAMDTSHRVYGPIIEVICESCALLLWPKVYAGAEGPIKQEDVGEFGEHSNDRKWDWIKIPKFTY